MRYLSLFVLAISAGLFASGCTKPSPAPSTTGGTNATTPIDEHEGHDHEGHSHEGESESAAPVVVEPEGGAGGADEFGAPPAEPQDGAAATEGAAEPEVSLDPAAPVAPENE
jgi:hypothetical protein